MSREASDLFDALRPVLGAKATALETAWLTAKPEERTEIEIVLELMRRQAVSKWSALLDSPQGAEADGTIRLGRIRHGKRHLGWLGVTPTELTQHLGTFGRSGSGKSNLCQGILAQLIKLRVPWIAFDYKRSTRSLAGLDLPVHVVSLGRDIGATPSFNILVPPPGTPLDTHQRQLLELIVDCWYAGDGVISILARVMEDCYAAAHPHYPTILDVRRHVEESASKGREALWRQSAVRILHQMTTGQLGRLLCRRTDADVLHRLRDHHTVLELDGLATSDANFLTQHILGFVTRCMLAESQREQLRMVCLVEEAHHLLGHREGGKETVLETCLREGREVGLGIILADQSISAISHVALANCFSTVVLNCRQRTDVNAAAGSLLLAEDAKSMLGTLPVGEAIARISARWPAPLHLEIPLLEVPKGKVTDQDVLERFLLGPFSRSTTDSAVSTDSAATRAPMARSVAIPPLPPADHKHTNTDSHPPPQETDSSHAFTLSDDPLQAEPELGRLLAHIAQHPFHGVAKRFDELGLSRRKGNAIKSSLLGLGYAQAVELPTPEGKTVLLQLTDAGRRWSARHHVSIAAVRGSLPHAWWQHEAARQLSESGWQVQTEQRIGRVVFDLFGQQRSRTVLVQVETGQSDWHTNVDALSAAAADSRAVLWLDPATLHKARGVLPSNVLLIQPKDLARWCKTLPGQ